MGKVLSLSDSRMPPAAGQENPVDKEVFELLNKLRPAHDPEQSAEISFEITPGLQRRFEAALGQTHVDMEEWLVGTIYRFCREFEKKGGSK